MRVLAVYIALAVIASSDGAEPVRERVKKHFRSENYTVTWADPPVYEPDSELEIGSGSGHGFKLRWIRFQPGKDSVNVLAIELDEGFNPYDSKWPPDRAPVSVKNAQLKPHAYAALLRDLAVVDSAKLKSVEQTQFDWSSNDLWVYARLTSREKSFLELNWAGYESSHGEMGFAKPRAAVRLAMEAVKAIEFKDHDLTAEERTWASAKFARDWKKFTRLDFHWWVRERYIQMIGVVGDNEALPVLREVLANDPPKETPRDASDERCVYYAIIAVTRLTKQDVRDKPVEEMDIDKTRYKVLELFRVEK